MSDDDQLRNKLFADISKAQRFADWIYHDVRLDCDDMANSRTSQRLHAINDQYGKEAMFGITGWWAISAYWRLEEAHKVRGMAKPPDLLPKNVEAVLESGDDSFEKRRAFVSAQQFISTLTHDDIEMAYAIFNAAYDSGVEEFTALMYSVLLLSIRISNIAEKVKEGG